MIYLASSWKNKYFDDVLAALVAAGHQVYNFRCPHGDPAEIGFTWQQVDPGCMDWTAEEYQHNLTHPLAEQQFKNDLEAMTACDTCVLLLPCGRSAHTEAGWFAGQGKRVFVLITDPGSFEPELMYKLFTGVCISVPELLAELER